jgi:hypothetical protein
VPPSDMPASLRALAQVSALQHYLVIVRGVMLRGAGIGSLWLPALALSGIALTVVALAWFRLRIGLDSDSLRQRLRALRHIYRRRQRERRARRRARKAGGRQVEKASL